RPVGPARLVALDHDALTAQRHGHIVGLHAVLDPGALLAFIFGDAVAAREGDADIARGFGQGRQVLGLTAADGHVVADGWPVGVGVVILADAVGDDDAGVGVRPAIPFSQRGCARQVSGA